MTKLVRNMNDEASAAFWREAEKSAASLDSKPSWMSAGIVLNEQNFVTFGPQTEFDENTANVDSKRT